VAIAFRVVGDLVVEEALADEDVARFGDRTARYDSRSATGPNSPRPALRRRGRKDVMAVTAYVLIQTEVGRSAAVATSVREISGVSSAEDVTGPYDVIVRAEASSVDDLGKMVVSKIQMIEGITRTITCPVVHL